MTTVEDAGDRHAFAQSARLGELFALALRNAALTLVTLTLYRFWSRSAMRRRLWARTAIQGDPLEYHGNGGELLRGFLISLPTFFLPAIFALYLAPLAFTQQTAGLIALGFYIVAAPLIAAGRFWMRRYQLSRTRWRGIRFALIGSAWSFAIPSTMWSWLQGLTLGWYTPTARMRRAKLMWEQTCFGDQPFNFAVGEEQLAKGLYGPFALGWFGTPIGFGTGAVIGGAASGLLLYLLGTAGVMHWNPDAPPAWLPIALGAAMLVFGGVGVIAVWTPYQAAAMKRIAALLELDGARFELRVTALGLTGVTVTGALIFVFSLGFLAPLSGAIYARHVLNRLTLVGTPRFAEIGQSLVAAPGSGEGLADAFDLDFGIGLI